MKTYRAILVRTVPWGERDRLVTVFEPLQGLLRARAVSSLEIRSKLAPLLVAPAIGDFTLARGRSAIPVLTGAELTVNCTHWRENSLRLRVAGAVLATLEGLDAPETVNQRFFHLAKWILGADPQGRELTMLAVFLVRALSALGLLGGETRCTLCSGTLTTAEVVAAPDLRTFICKSCFNRLYGHAEVSIIFVKRKHLRLVEQLAGTSVADCDALSLSEDDLSFILSLAASRLADILPSTTAAVLPLTALTATVRN